MPTGCAQEQQCRSRPGYHRKNPQLLVKNAGSAEARAFSQSSLESNLLDAFQPKSPFKGGDQLRIGSALSKSDEK